MRQWEHMVHLIPCDPQQLVAALNKIEPDGWELCSLLQVAIQGQPQMNDRGRLQEGKPVVMFQMVVKRPRQGEPSPAEAIPGVGNTLTSEMPIPSSLITDGVGG